MVSTQHISPKVKNETSMATRMTSSQHCTGGSDKCKQSRKKKDKSQSDWKGRSKIVLPIDDMIIHV